MLQLVEMEGKMTENGCIEIPAVVLEQAGICTGDTVKLVYMAEDGELKNTAKEFLLARAGQDVAEELAKEENIAFQIPEELLRDAGISSADHCWHHHHPIRFIHISVPVHGFKCLMHGKQLFGSIGGVPSIA